MSPVVSKYGIRTFVKFVCLHLALCKGTLFKVIHNMRYNDLGLFHMSSSAIRRY